MKTRISRHELILAPLRLGYALWAAAAFLVVGLGALVLLVVLPRETQRRRAARRMARIFLAVAGMPLTVKSPERIPAGQCVVVCNHASYLDGIVLTAALPPRFAFVIKREMSGVPLAGALLHRLGSQFVERFDRHKSAADARRVLRNATQGQSVVFFPEGTFTRTPGLLKFHAGAFVTAARVGCPLVPAVVRGTRRALPPAGGLPLPGRIQLEILPPLAVTEDVAGQSVSRLREQARTAMLAALGEPDLTCSDDTDPPLDTRRARSAPTSRP
ncbi:MAG TPA: lysophospholipid acyltransferase family protein [Steroidobacteraceae bacterium]